MKQELPDRLSTASLTGQRRLVSHFRTHGWKYAIFGP
jgi:hypothetical protein